MVAVHDHLEELGCLVVMEEHGRLDGVEEIGCLVGVKENGHLAA